MAREGNLRTLGVSTTISIFFRNAILEVIYLVGVSIIAMRCW